MTTLRWHCKDCAFNCATDEVARGHPWDRPEYFDHVLFERPTPTSPAVRVCNSSDGGGCYIDDHPQGMLSLDPFRDPFKPKVSLRLEDAILPDWALPSTRRETAR